MSRLYLITGFLGAGKTTFLKNFIKEFSGERIHLIVNEFGKEGVDGRILDELGMVLDEINNGSIFCSCRLDKFEEVLEKALVRQPDVIIIEASGLSNPTNVRKILDQEGKFESAEYMGSICLIDAKQFLKVYGTAVVVKKQIAVSDMVLINKTDLATPETVADIRKTIRNHRPDVPVYETTFGRIKKEWLDRMSETRGEDADLMQSADITLRKYLLHIKENQTLYTLQKFLEMFLIDTYRVKGILELQEGCYLISCTGEMFHAEVFKGSLGVTNDLVVLSGNGLPTKRAIKKAMEWYPDIAEIIK